MSMTWAETIDRIEASPLINRKMPRLRSPWPPSKMNRIPRLMCMDPVFTVDSGPGKVFVSSKDEGRYENGKWIAGRRINGDEMFEPSLPKTKVGMLKVKLVRIQ